MSHEKDDKHFPYAKLGAKRDEPATHWRSIAEKERDPAVTESLDVEFPAGTVAPSGFSRREAIKLAGASLAMGTLSGCIRRPEEEILPYVRQPEQVIPGVRTFYATAMPRSEGAVGLLVEAHEGRPTKIEGNPHHPSSLGGSDVWAQAEVLKLYDPDRARAPRKAGKVASWDEWDGFAKETFDKLAAAQGKGLALLVEDHGAPTFERLLGELPARYPEAKVYRWDPTAPDHALLGAELAFGPGARAHYDLAKAKVLFALDSNFLVEGPEHLRLARQFGGRRNVLEAADVEGMNRLYVAEGVFSTTGANADHRLRVATSLAPEVLKALAATLATKHGLDLGELAKEGVALPPEQAKFVAALANDLANSKGSCAILVGERQPAAVHALAYALNLALGAGAAGAFSVTKQEGATARAPQDEQLAALTKSMAAGEVQTLVVFEANPVYAAPGALKFAEALAKVPTVIHAGVLPDETAAKAAWHLPLAHFLETWSDARAFDGTLSIVQPLILPLFGSRPDTTLLAALVGHAETADRKLVEETWRGEGMPLKDGKAWRAALRDGVVADSAWAAAPAEANKAAVAGALAAVKGAMPSKDALELVAIHGHLLDGRLANVSWLQELPDGMSKLCWDNAVLVSPALAKELGIESAVVKNSYTSDVVTLSVDGRSVTAPTFVLPGLGQYTVAMVAGYGKAAGEVARGVGVDVNPLLAQGRVLAGVKLAKTGETAELCSTQDHFGVPGNPFKELTFAQMSGASGGDRVLGMGGRPLDRIVSGEAYAKEGGKVVAEGNIPAEYIAIPGKPSAPARPTQPTQEITYEGQQWGMAIDLTRCIGCNVCSVACTAENNIPAVGREQVLLGRELHWIRVDRYFSGDVDQPRASHQPLNCMHCENAPCEPVCPVSATVHDEEGVNSMAYNRCIGTRYCANNCPFKVRRYNYLDFSDSGNFYVPEKKAERMKTLALQRNPDVTVRYRGVMEKCTYCTQRIEEAKITAKREGGDRKNLPDGAVVPACAQACPTQAIVFGNINDPNSQVAKLKASDRNYEMLQELNIRPRTTYLAQVKNENEELT